LWVTPDISEEFAKAYNRRMAHSNPIAPIEVVCPCCQSVLTIDVALGVVLAHETPAKPVRDVDISNAANILAGEAQRREDKFQQSWDAERNKEDVLSRKFEEALKKAKEKPAEKPIRDFDL
jgi:hypothetical protein